VKEHNTPKPTNTLRPTRTEIVKEHNTPKPTNTVRPTRTEIVKEHNTPKPTNTVRPTRTEIVKEHNTPKPTNTLRPTRTEIVKEHNTPKPTNTERPTRTPIVKEERTDKPTKTARPTRTPLPPKPGPTFVKDHLVAQCAVDPKGQLNGQDMMHVTLFIYNDSGGTVLDINPEAPDIQGDWSIERSPLGMNELDNGRTGRFSWNLTGSGPVQVFLSATFTDPEGVDKNTGPIACQ
jgi:hypothetical protein